MSRSTHLANLDEITQFDSIIDARSPAEFADDHIPGAISLAVLSNEERIQIGTRYKQVSAFEAKKLGAVLVARNIAKHIEAHLLDKPREWRPLVYCWRGGQRSGAFSLILREIGWDAHRLQGGYKAWRSHLIARLAELPARFQFRVIAGATGSAKSRILEALATKGAQILHLEEIAAHKGSVLGNLPDRPQPSQRSFETALHSALTTLDSRRPVFVEAESRKIGRLHVPAQLILAIRAAPCISINATRKARVDFLLRDYDYAVEDKVWLRERIAQLRGLQSHDTLERWQAMAASGEHRQLVRELLERHYDALYQRSQQHNFAQHGAAQHLTTDDLSPAGIDALASQLLHSET